MELSTDPITPRNDSSSNAAAASRWVVYEKATSRSINFELSQAKTLITHGRTGAAKFLGYEITVQHSDQTLKRGRRAVNGIIRLRVPTAVIKAKSAPYLQHGKPERREKLVNFDDHTIISTYGAEYRGIVQYYWD